eukprot:GHVN01088982.1.p1 GENE.GHVN01088982.1~~GHVN01088982.1.p1  ORF type:complete len:732 (+),score=127.84 GHVN01088982.1:39-2234(+)
MRPFYGLRPLFRAVYNVECHFTTSATSCRRWRLRKARRGGVCGFNKTDESTSEETKVIEDLIQLRRRTERQQQQAGEVPVGLEQAMDRLLVAHKSIERSAVPPSYGNNTKAVVEQDNGVRPGRMSKVRRMRQLMGTRPMRRGGQLKMYANGVSLASCEITPLAPVWREHGACRWLYHNGLLMPALFKGISSVDCVLRCRGLEQGTRQRGGELSTGGVGVCDVSYQRLIRFIGLNALEATERIFTQHIGGCRPLTLDGDWGDVRYGALINHMGDVVDVGEVMRILRNDGSESDEVLIAVSGHRFDQTQRAVNQVVDKMGSLSVEVDFDFMSPSGNQAGVAVLGSGASEAIVKAISSLGAKFEVSEMPSWTARLVELGAAGGVALLVRSMIGGEEAFTWYGDRSSTGGIARRVLQQSNSSVMGVVALDLLRIEAGVMRVGADINAVQSDEKERGVAEEGEEEIWEQGMGLDPQRVGKMRQCVTEGGMGLRGALTPVACGLTWTIDEDKLGDNCLWGSRKMLRQIKSSKTDERFKRRVGLRCESYIPPGSLLTRYDTRQVVGQVSSVGWSPVMDARVAMGYVAQDSSFNGVPLIARFKQRAPPSYAPFLRKKDRKEIDHYVRCVVQVLPLVPHQSTTYQRTQSQVAPTTQPTPAMGGMNTPHKPQASPIGYSPPPSFNLTHPIPAGSKVTTSQRVSSRFVQEAAGPTQFEPPRKVKDRKLLKEMRVKMFNKSQL